jgi:hypothetical protein
MKTLTRHSRCFGEPFKTERRVHKIAQNETCRLWFASQKQGCRLVQERLSERRIPFDPSNYGLLEISCKCHGLYLLRFLSLRSAGGGAFRALYSGGSYRPKAGIGGAGLAAPKRPYEA